MVGEILENAYDVYKRYSDRKLSYMFEHKGGQGYIGDYLAIRDRLIQKKANVGRIYVIGKNDAGYRWMSYFSKGIPKKEELIKMKDDIIFDDILDIARDHEFDGDFDKDMVSVCIEALKIVNQDRQDQYGPPEDSFAGIGRLWQGYLGEDVSDIDVANMMMLLKIQREKWKHKRDNIVDIIGYALCLLKMRKKDQ
jgi:hypothetical protein